MIITNREKIKRVNYIISGKGAVIRLAAPGVRTRMRQSPQDSYVSLFVGHTRPQTGVYEELARTLSPPTFSRQRVLVEPQREHLYGTGGTLEISGISSVLVMPKRKDRAERNSVLTWVCFGKIIRMRRYSGCIA